MPRLPFTAAEVALLLEAEFEPADDWLYIRRSTVALGCGCCHESESIDIVKSDDGTFSVSYNPVNGGSQHADTPTLERAIAYF